MTVVSVNARGYIGSFKIEDPEERVTILNILRGQLRAHAETVADRKRESDALAAMRLAAEGTKFYEMLEKSADFKNYMSRSAMKCEKAGTSVLHNVVVDSGARFAVHVIREQMRDHFNESVPAFHISALGTEGYIFDHKDYLYVWLLTPLV
jgi:hypothetical protein